ncbi:MAG: xanthine dehydrogenase accessory factor [Flavobacteriaceae bacterium]|jgi:xanthine dehydrogenase accessory factor
MKLWRILYDHLVDGHDVALLYVHNSDGSSPGRQGFKMLVSDDGKLHGSIGGGPMEHKLVELGKSKLNEGHFPPSLHRQIHKSNIPNDRSGMICSGEQTVGIYHISPADKEMIGEIINSKGDKTIELSNLGIALCTNSTTHKKRIRYVEEESTWKVSEDFKTRLELHIIGAGHVGLALSNLGHQLDFNVYIYDTRENLNTISENSFAQFTHIQSYSEIGNHISSGENKYVVLMSFGFRTDKIALQHLLNKEFNYLGMMGSKEKIKTLINELKSEGADSERLNNVYAPIGLAIASKTPMEIAVSVMAEIIQLKNG